MEIQELKGELRETISPIHKISALVSILNMFTINGIGYNEELMQKAQSKLSELIEQL